MLGSRIQGCGKSFVPSSSYSHPIETFSHPPLTHRTGRKSFRSRCNVVTNLVMRHKYFKATEGLFTHHSQYKYITRKRQNTPQERGNRRRVRLKKMTNRSETVCHGAGEQVFQQEIHEELYALFSCDCCCYYSSDLGSHEMDIGRQFHSDSGPGRKKKVKLKYNLVTKFDSLSRNVVHFLPHCGTVCPFRYRKEQPVRPGELDKRLPFDLMIQYP